MAPTPAMTAVLRAAPIGMEVADLEGREETSYDEAPMAWRVRSDDVPAVEACVRDQLLIYVPDDDGTGWNGRSMLVLTDLGRAALADL